MKSMLGVLLAVMVGLVLLGAAGLLFLAWRAKPLPGIRDALATLPETERAALQTLTQAAGIRLEELRPIGALPLTLEHEANRRAVGIAEGHVRTLRVAGTSLTSCPDLSALAQLEALFLDGNSLTQWPAFRALPALTHLNLSSNRLAIIATDGALPAIRMLQLKENQITDLTPLARWSSLRELDLAGNPVTNFASLVPLPLERVNLARTRIDRLPPNLPSKGQSSWEVDLSETPVVNPPGIIAERQYRIVTTGSSLGDATRRGQVFGSRVEDAEGTASHITSLQTVEIMTHADARGLGPVNLEASIESGKARVFLLHADTHFTDPWFRSGHVKGFGFLQGQRWVYADLEAGQSPVRVRGLLDRGPGPRGQYQFQIEPREGTEIRGLKYRISSAETPEKP